jgi:hypothetical protein
MYPQKGIFEEHVSKGSSIDDLHVEEQDPKCDTGLRSAINMPPLHL